MNTYLHAHLHTHTQSILVDRSRKRTMTCKNLEYFKHSVHYFTVITVILTEFIEYPDRFLLRKQKKSPLRHLLRPCTHDIPPHLRNYVLLMTINHEHSSALTTWASNLTIYLFLLLRLKIT